MVLIPVVMLVGTGSCLLPSPSWLTRACRSAAISWAAAPLQSVATTTNSSPPLRKKWSVMRSRWRTALATRFRTRSPILWPKRSLILVRPSTSIVMQLRGSPVRRQRRHSSLSLKNRALRLPQPMARFTWLRIAAAIRWFVWKWRTPNCRHLLLRRTAWLRPALGCLPQCSIPAGFRRHSDLKSCR